MLNHRIIKSNEPGCAVCKHFDGQQTCLLATATTFSNQTCDNIEKTELSVPPQLEVAIYSMLLYNSLLEAESDNVFKHKLKKKVKILMTDLEIHLKELYQILHKEGMDDDFLVKLTNLYDKGISNVLASVDNSYFEKGKK